MELYGCIIILFYFVQSFPVGISIAVIATFIDDQRMHNVCVKNGNIGTLPYRITSIGVIVIHNLQMTRLQRLIHYSCFHFVLIAITNL